MPTVTTRFQSTGMPRQSRSCPGARAGAEALIKLADRHGLRRGDDLLLAWMRAHRVGD